jgi:hypothetical protein
MLLLGLDRQGFVVDVNKVDNGKKVYLIKKAQSL